MGEQDDFMSQGDAGTSEQGSTEPAGDDGGAAPKPPTGEPTADLSRLQSERDKERARANKAEKELMELKGKASAKDASAPKAVPAEVQEWILAAKENVRKVLFDTNADFAAYGIDPALIVGETPAEMRQSAESLSKFVAELKGKVRGQVLVEHGFDPEPRSSSGPGRQDFATMDSKDFNALFDKALRG